MAFTPASGTAGRVTISGTAVAGISSWRRAGKTTTIPIPHFESSANDDGLVQANKLRGLGENSVSIEGIVDLDAAGTHSVLENGKYVTADFLVNRTSAKGYDGVAGWISDFSLGTKVSNEAASFTATLDVDGVFPTFGTVS